MRTVVTELLVAGGLFGGMIACAAGGRALTLRAKHAPEAPPGARAIEGAILALLGLLLAFTFSGAAERFHERKLLAIEETNAIGTAWLRLDLLPEEARAPERALFLRYLDSRIETYRRLPDVDSARQEVTRTQALQGEIWRRAAAVARAQPMPVGAVLLPALNAMFDLASARLARSIMHPPSVITWMLFGVALISAGLMGHALVSRAARPWAHLLVFAAIIAITVFVIRDLEYPRLGLIRVDAADQLLVDLRRSLEPR